MASAPNVMFICTDSGDSGSFSTGNTPTLAWENYQEYCDSDANINHHTFYKAIEIEVELSVVEVEQVVQV